jgi:nucleoside-diphosphate-sugar epimerase
VNVLVTGATGLAGSEIVERLRSTTDGSVVGTSRRGRDPGVLRWDMRIEQPPAALWRHWDVVVHAAADTRWTLSPQDAFAANVNTVAALASLVADDTHVVHISTAYATGLRADTQSADLADYRNTYEWSKAAAERLARKLFGRLTILRPPLIIGRRADGRAARFAGLYTMLRAITSSMVPAIVATESAYFEVIPVDALAELAVGFAVDGPTADVAIIAGGTEAPRVGTVIDLVTRALNEWRTARDLAELDRPRTIEPASWRRFFLPFVREQLSPRQRRVIELLQPFEPYLTIADPLTPTHAITNVDPAILAAVRYWAEVNPRWASLSQRPWRLPEPGAEATR